MQTLLKAAELEGRDMPSGGGFTNAGLDGTYYRDPNFSSAAFSRRDLRIDFDWGATIKPGGSTSPGFRDVGTTNYSARWTGQLVAQFSETYTFSGFADDAFTLELKPAGTTGWTTVVAQPALTGAGFNGSYTLTAGQPYDVRVSFQQFGGSAAAQLQWASPSTPKEVIGPLTESGMNNPDGTTAFNDLVKGARNSWDGAAGMDANGWPTSDARYIFQESLNQGLDVDPLARGQIWFSFHGKADLSVYGNVSQPSLTYSYDPATNTTTGTFLAVPNACNASNMLFMNSSRTGQPGGPGGVTDLKMIRPTAPDATTNPNPDALFSQAAVAYARHYTVVRHQYVANQQKDWTDRTLPTFFNQAGGSRTAPTYTLPWGDSTSDNGWSWEYKVMFANETGTDLMISLPVLATGRTPADTQSYLVKLAQLIKYGSDGMNPYTAPTVNPVYPPLNPNLRVYLELGNELWNWASVFYTDYNNLNMLVKNSVQANDADFRAINYDNLPTDTDANGNYNSINVWRYRMAVLRTAQASNIFRSVFGDAAMPGTSAEPRIRPVYEWQYANSNSTASIGLVWADRYFNKSDPASTYAGPARPVNYFLWGGGGATYYAANNSNGLTALLPDSGFEAATVPAGYTQNPAGTGWTFAGTVGVARDAGSGDDIPAADDGAQVGYVAGTGRLTSTFTVPAVQTSDQYAVSFKALNRLRTTGTGDAQNLRVYLDYGTPQQVDLTASTFSQPNGYTPPAVGNISGWNARNVFWTQSGYYYTKSIGLTPGSAHTITLAGTGAADQIAFVEDVRVTSVDAIFAGGLPGGGEAAGQPAGQNIRTSMSTAVNWAAAFGLKHLAYEGGWSLGGDDGGSYIQLKAKYGDPRTAQAQSTFMDYYAEAGGQVNVFGTYAQLPSWGDYYAEQGLLDPARYPIIQGIDRAANTLPNLPTNGTVLPAVLDRTSVTLADGADATNSVLGGAASWLSWNVVAERSGVFNLSVTTGAVGSAVVLVDDAPVAAGATGSPLAGSLFLTRGLHTVKVRSTAGGFPVSSVSVTAQGAPAVPTVTALSERNDSVSLSWAAVPGAAGYVVRYGTTPGQYTTRIDVGAVTSWTGVGLTDDTVYSFVVSAYAADGAASLPSAPRTVSALTEGVSGRVARWQFAGLVANGAAAPTTAPVSGAASNLMIGPLTRGPGLVPGSGWVTSYNPDRFASESVNNVWAQTLPDAIANNQYYQFTVAPAAGYKLSLDAVQVQAWFSHPSATTQIAAQYSTDGVNFAPLTATGAINSAGGFTLPLTGLANLQGSVATVTFRVYTFGAANYTATGIGLGGADEALTVRGRVRGVPTVEAVTVDDGSAQRSQVRHLTVAFNTLVTPAANAFTVTPAAGGAAIPITWTAADVAGRTVVTISFPTGSVADGQWRLTTAAAAVAHRSGGGDLVMATSAASNFQRLFGDLDGDGKVDSSDLTNFRPAFGQRTSQSLYNAVCDYDGNGTVDTLDMAQFRRRFSRALT